MFNHLKRLGGAGAQIVKALAARVGVELRGHGELHEKVIKIAKEAVGNGIRLLWQSGISFHQNFYESWLHQKWLKER